MKGFDISENNGYVDFEAAKAAGYEFVIVRCSYGKHGRDEMFLDNVNRAHAAGLKVGAYHYGYALNVHDAELEAQNCKDAIDEAGVFLELPVWYDMEDADGYKARNGFLFGAYGITEICRTFLSGVAPLNCGVYASQSWLADYIDWRSLGCSVWNAEWMSGYNPAPNTAYDSVGAYMWQYSDKVNIGGKLFDGDWLYD